MEGREMKRIIMLGIVLGMVLLSLWGCFIPYYDDDGGRGGHGGGRGDRDDRHEQEDKEAERFLKCLCRRS